jgi:serine/threonine protein kinase
MSSSHEHGFPTTAYSPPAPKHDSDASDQTMISDGSSGYSTVTAPDFVPGYELVRELGRGGMGVVYLARQQGLNRLVALKMVLSGKHANETDLARFKAEAGAVAQLQHPQIVQVIETGEYQGNPWFSMEYVSGGSLDRRLQGRPLAPREAARVISLLADAVAHAHSRGVLHRDLKPGNILVQQAEAHNSSVDTSQRNLRGPSKSNTINLEVGPKGATETISNSRQVTLKITDFGLAKQLEAGGPAGSRTQDGTILGSPSYMAPEQAAGDATKLSPATDIYSLGAILYELLTGRPPFRASTAWDTILQVLHDEPVPPTRLQPRLPKDLETICLKCLAKDPKKRYDTVGELEADLERFLNDEPVHARPTPWWERTWKAAKRRPAFTTLVLAVVLGAAAIIGLVLDNNARLQHERDLAREAQKQAEREQQKAHVRLEKAVEAVERLLINTASENWSRRPELQEERRALLEEAVKFYQSFLDQESDDPLLRRQAAKAYYSMAGVYLLLGEALKAEEKLKRARALQEGLTTEFPDNPEYKHDLIQTINFLGNAEAMKGQVSMSETTYDKAARQAEALADAFPDNSEFQLTLVQTYLSLAKFYAVQRPAKSVENQQKAYELAKAVYEKNDKPYKHRLFYAATMLQMAQFQINNGRTYEAGKYLPQIKEQLDTLAGMTAPSAQLRDQYDFALSTFTIVNGYYLVRTGHQEAGETELRRGVKLLDELLSQRPNAFLFRTLQVNALQTLGDTLEKHKSKEARSTLKRAYQLQEKLAKDLPDMPWLKMNGLHQRSMYLVMRARDGDLNGIEEAVQEVQATPVVLIGTAQAPKYNLACVYAQGSKHQTDAAEKERWAARAVRMLEDLYRSRYFSRDLEINHLSVDADLDPLRDRADFKAFMKHFENRPRAASVSAPGKLPPSPPGKVIVPGLPQRKVPVPQKG